MRQEDKEIKYRPILAERLSESLKFAIKFYNLNYQFMYYKLLAEMEKEKDKDKEKSDFLFKVAKCFEGSFADKELFYEEYEKNLKSKVSYRNNFSG